MATTLYSEVLLLLKNYYHSSYVAVPSSIQIINIFLEIMSEVTVNILLVELHNSSPYVHIHTLIPLECLNLTPALL